MSGALMPGTRLPLCSATALGKPSSPFLFPPLAKLVGRGLAGTLLPFGRGGSLAHRAKLGRPLRPIRICWLASPGFELEVFFDTPARKSQMGSDTWSVMPTNSTSTSSGATRDAMRRCTTYAALRRSMGNAVRAPLMRASGEISSPPKICAMMLVNERRTRRRSS